MKKSILKLAALVGAAAMLLAGCGAKDVSGEYTTEVKVVDFMTEHDKASLAALEEYGMTFFNDNTMKMDLTMNSDKTFAAALNADDLIDQMTEGFKANGATLVNSILEQQGVTEDMYDALFESMGVSSMEEFQDTMVQSMMEGLEANIDDMKEQLESSSVSGTYTVKGNTVNFTVEKEEDEMDFDQAEILSDGSLKMVAENEGKSLNLVFTKNN